MHPEGTVPRAEAGVTPLAVVPGTLECQRTQRGGEGLGAAPGQACLATALAGQARSLLVAPLGIELPGNGTPHELQRYPSRFGLKRLEVGEATDTDQGLDLGREFLRERRFKPPFFSGVAGLFASRCASHKRVLTSTNSRVRR